MEATLGRHAGQHGVGQRLGDEHEGGTDPADDITRIDMDPPAEAPLAHRRMTNAPAPSTAVSAACSAMVLAKAFLCVGSLWPDDSPRLRRRERTASPTSSTPSGATVHGSTATTHNPAASQAKPVSAHPPASWSVS